MKITNYLGLTLRKLEKYTKTDMVYLFRGAFWLGLAQITVSISGLLLTMILANFMTPDGLGEYRFLFAGFTLLGVVALPGMRTALRESTPKGYHGNLRLAFKCMFRWGLISSLISFIVAIYYFTNNNINLALGFIVIGLATPIYNAATGYLEYLTAIKQLGLTTIYTAVTRFAVLLFTAPIAFFFPKITWAILAAYLFGTIIPNLLFHYKTLRKFTRLDDPVDLDISRYAFHISIMTALGVIAGQIDKIFVWNFIGASALGLFYVAYSFPLTVSQYLLIVPTLAFAKFGKADAKVSVRATLLPKIFKYSIVILFGALIYILFAPYIFNLIFPQWLSAVPYSQVLILTSFFSAFMPIKTYLTTTKQTRALYLISIIPPILRIVAAILLIIPFGVWGAVYSLFVEGIVRTVLLLYFFIKTK